MREFEVENYLKKQIEKIGLRILKFESPGTAGVPDRIILLPDKQVMWVEVKRPKGKLRPLQVKRKEQWEEAGQEVRVVTTKKEAADLAAEIYSTRLPEKSD